MDQSDTIDIRTSVFVSFGTYPIFNMVSEVACPAEEVSSRSLWSSPCSRRLHRNRILRILNRISTCNSNTST